MIDYSIYQSPFSYRYGSKEFRGIWSENNTRLYWRWLWMVLSLAEYKFGLMAEDEVNDIIKHYPEVDIEKSLEVEKETKHDLVAELKVFADQCEVGGRVLHLGCTSMDIKDNAEVLQIRDSLDIIINKLKFLLEVFSKKILETKDLVCMGYTHLQPAEPTTFGYRLSFYVQDLLCCYERLLDLRKNLKAKGFKGAVGNSASFMNLLGDKYFDFENRLKELMGIDFFDIVSQTYPRLQDFLVLNELSSICGVLSKFAFDIRILQSFKEVTEPFSENQTGSSAMPTKRNPIFSEKICSLAREISVYPKVMWDNYSLSLLERTLDDSANRRNIIPESFFICDEILISSLKLLNGMKFNHKIITDNLKNCLNYEGVLNEIVKRGGDRQNVYTLLNKNGYYNKKILKYITIEEIENMLHNNRDIGIASIQAEKFANLIKEKIEL